jgi:hypothetical protein
MADNVGDSDERRTRQITPLTVVPLDQDSEKESTMFAAAAFSAAMIEKEARGRDSRGGSAYVRRRRE